jgi:hypothetical protein
MRINRQASSFCSLIVCGAAKCISVFSIFGLITSANAQQVLDNVDLDGLGKSALVVRSLTTSPAIKVGRYSGNSFTFTDLADPGLNYRVLGATRLDAGLKTDLLLQNISTGDFGEARSLLDFDSSKDRLLRNVKRVWDVQAVGDLDGDGFGDLVWRYMADDPRDTGVSFIWFTNGAANSNATVQNPSNVLQVRKRGGAPLSWTLLGARDINGDGAADMVYISPEGNIRVLMATPARTCANLFAGTVPVGMSAQKFGNFSGDGRGDILYRNNVTGAVALAKLNATGLSLPPFTGQPDDPIASCTASSLVISNTAVTNLPASDPTWTLYGVGDFDGNGITDVVWLRPNGQLTAWLMNANAAAPTEVANAGTAPFTVSATLSGIFIDAPVSGLAYSTTSGVTGVTDAAGTFRYNAGDTITFSLGTLVLGSSMATPLVSPFDIASGNTNKLTNLLVLLQSLDSDGNAANGITITAPTAAGVTAAINLNNSPATFASSANTALQAAMTAGGLTGSIKTVDQANTHYNSQAFAMLSRNIWVLNTADRVGFIRATPTGEYLQGDAIPTLTSGATVIERAGVEYGFLSVIGFDLNGYRLASSPVVNTNAQAGFSNPLPTDRLRSDGAALITESGDRIVKAENIPGSIVGVWALGSTTVKTQTFMFMSNGKVMMIDPIGDPGCGSPGVELGSYNYNPTTRALTTSNFTYDTNGCAGLRDAVNNSTVGATLTFTLNPDGITATVFDPTSSPPATMTAYRISR